MKVIYASHCHSSVASALGSRLRVGGDTGASVSFGQVLFTVFLDIIVHHMTLPHLCFASASAVVNVFAYLVVVVTT